MEHAIKKKRGAIDGFIVVFPPGLWTGWMQQEYDRAVFNIVWAERHIKETTSHAEMVDKAVRAAGYKARADAFAEMAQHLFFGMSGGRDTPIKPITISFDRLRLLTAVTETEEETKASANHAGAPSAPSPARPGRARKTKRTARPRR